MSVKEEHICNNSKDGIAQPGRKNCGHSIKSNAEKINNLLDMKGKDTEVAVKRLHECEAEDSFCPVKRECHRDETLSDGTVGLMKPPHPNPSGEKKCFHSAFVKDGLSTNTEILPIELSIDLTATQLPPWERYFTKRIVDDICLLIHSNRIAVVTLMPTHPALANGRSIRSVDFAKRAENAVRGKGKKGAQMLKVDSALCEVVCDDGSKHTIRACIAGKLMEVNFRLVDQPSLLSMRPQSEGYIAVMLPYESRPRQREQASAESHSEVVDD